MMFEAYRNREENLRIQTRAWTRKMEMESKRLRMGTNYLDLE